MKKNLFYVIFIIFCLPAHSQILEGFIIDSTNNVKLSYVNIALKNVDKGTYSNEEGFYKLNLKNINLNDSLIVSYIGYENKIIKLSDFNKGKKYELNVELLPKNDILDEVVISSEKAKYEWFSDNLGTKKKTLFTSSVPFGYEVCVFVKNEKNKIAKLEELKLKFKKQDETEIEVYRTYYRISFYRKNTNNFPGELLSYENIIIHPENNNKTIKINLSEKKIFLPMEGLFVGIETINPSDNSPNNSMYLTYPNLLYTHSEEKITFKRYRGKKWYKELRKSVFKKDHFKVPYLSLKIKYVK